MPVSQPDILLIGGGVIGLTTALKLADRGVSVTILDRQFSGKEASWAGAGMLPPGDLSHALSPESRLRSYSHSLWSGLAADLLERTGIDNGYRVCGAIEVFHSKDLDDFSNQMKQWQKDGVNACVMEFSEALVLVPGLSPDFSAIAFLPDFGQVRNPRHLRALTAACLQKGVVIKEHVESLRFRKRDDLLIEVKLMSETFSFEKVCVTAGAWSPSLLYPLGLSIPIKPIRGQIVQMQMTSRPFGCVVEHGRRYLVPRGDGLLLIGSTEEDVGFDKQNTEEGVSDLLKFAEGTVSSLSSGTVLRTWAGLRPGTPDGLPLIGSVPSFSNLFVGAGHFRSGLQMSPGTASVLADLMLNSSPAISLVGFEPGRFDQQPTN